MKKIIAFCFLASLVFPPVVLGKIGVGVGTGKIEYNEELKPGGTYDLPPLAVYNTGDEPAEYEVAIAYHSGIPQKSPSRDWFSFKPLTFHLEPLGTQTVNITLNLPLKAEPGDYFCYAEARPIDKSADIAGAKIGVAAAAKVYFTIAPAGLWQALYYKAIYLWKHYAPWTYVITAVLVLAMLITLLRRFFTFRLGIGRKKKDESIVENPAPQPQNISNVSSPKNQNPPFSGPRRIV